MIDYDSKCLVQPMSNQNNYKIIKVRNLLTIQIKTIPNRNGKQTKISLQNTEEKEIN